jgi:primosomal protein N' (replication factor Y)
MHYYEVAPIRIVRPGSDSFTYASENTLEVGQIVTIEVGKKQLIGVVIRKTNEPNYSTKLIHSLIETAPLPGELIALSTWLSSYYATPLATVLQTVLPRGVDKKRRLKKTSQKTFERDRTKIVFNKQQQTVIQTIADSKPATFLLQGVTGSGKTRVYIEVIKQVTAKGMSAIVLVPEIALTSQIIAEFAQHFEYILITHSTMTEAERHLVWQKALHATEPTIVIGPRSALFMPLKNIGAIIVDEAHEPSFKQEQAPRYSALRAATMLGRYHKAKVIFGSATPSVTDRYLAERTAGSLLILDKPARLNRVAPSLLLIDMTKRTNFTHHRFLSNQLVDQITETVESGKQALIFHNRRGSASTTLCENCGWTAECPRCFVPLTLHADQHLLRCHICDHKEKVPTFCPVCRHTDIIFKGIGTKLIESELKKVFSKARIARFDADNTDDQTVNARYEDLYSGDIDIAIGTQVVAKGLDLPHLRMVGVIQADSGLSLPDFSARERTFQLLAQVVGRVGRNEHVTQVLVQTYQPTHPSVTAGLTQDYEAFYTEALKERRRGVFPPFTYLLKLTCIYGTEAAAIRNAKLIANQLTKNVADDVTILGPTPSFYERQHDTYRWQLTLKSPKREHLVEALQFVPSTHWQFELDPTSLL